LERAQLRGDAPLDGLGIAQMFAHAFPGGTLEVKNTSRLFARPAFAPPASVPALARPYLDPIMKHA